MSNKMKRKKEPIEILLKPINEFLHREASGGILLIICTVIALVWANTAWSQTYYDLLAYTYYHFR